MARCVARLIVVALVAAGCSQSPPAPESSTAPQSSAAAEAPSPVARAPKRDAPSASATAGVSSTPAIVADDESSGDGAAQRPRLVTAKSEHSAVGAQNAKAPSRRQGRSSEPGEDPPGAPIPAARVESLPNPPPPQIDEAQVAAAGIRKLTSQHLTLYTDLPSRPAIDELPAVFDLAYPQWCDYFGVPQLADKPWHITASIIGQKQRFNDVGLFPADLPRFLHAYCLGNQVWIYEQGSDYYRRHLLLHEGTHAFMAGLFGSCGVPWYMEGMAELLGTHMLDQGRLKLGYFPIDRQQTPLWGRVKSVHDAVTADRGLKLVDVLDYAPVAYLQVEPYAWSWATAAFLDSHPRYRERFRQLPPRVKQPAFNSGMIALYGNDWPQLVDEWQAYIADLEYGYDFTRNAIDFRPGQPLGDATKTVTIAADRGWQSSGLRLEAGKTYTLDAQGRYQVGDQPKPWLSEPDGVTIRYWHGRPLGVLLAAVHPETADPRAMSVFASPQTIGAHATITPSKSGTLYLRVNDSPAELSDNAGTVEVRMSEP